MPEQKQLTPAQALDVLADTIDKIALTGPDRRFINSAFAVLLPLVQPPKVEDPKVQ